MTRITIDPDGLRSLFEHAKSAGTVGQWCALALEYAVNSHKQGTDLAKRVEELEAAIGRAKAIDPYVGAGARGDGLSGSDAASEVARAYRDAVHDALELTPVDGGAAE